MIDLLQAGKDFYWDHREAFRVTGAIAAITGVNFCLLVWFARRMTELSHMRERVSRLTDGLALLTDTTEAGMTALVREVEQLGKRKSAARAVPRTTMSRRVADAARRGEAITQIAEAEALSESEVRLHLSLAKSQGSEAAETRSVA